jgi:hypothetical protein
MPDLKCPTPGCNNRKDLSYPTGQCVQCVAARTRVPSRPAPDRCNSWHPEMPNRCILPMGHIGACSTGKVVL